MQNLQVISLIPCETPCNTTNIIWRTNADLETSVATSNGSIFYLDGNKAAATSTKEKIEEINVTDVWGWLNKKSLVSELWTEHEASLKN